MKKFKGFTLLELIIVMAILAILMTAIIQLFKPIRETYVDATLYENQRTTQNGIMRYISESVRFSTDLGIYTNNKASTATDAIEKFAAEYLPAYGVNPGDSNYNDNVKELKKYAEVIIIDNNKYNYRGKDYTGRLLRRKFTGNELVNVEPTPANIATNAVNSDWRIALGESYYGDSSYSILLKDPDPAPPSTAWEANEGIEIRVTSQLNYSMRNYVSGSGVVSNSGLVICRNQAEAGGVFDTTNYDPTAVLLPNSKVYIVFLNERIKLV